MSEPLFARFASAVGYSAGHEVIAAALWPQMGSLARSHTGVSGFMRFDIYISCIQICLK